MQQRRLAAILAADVVGFSKLMAEDEAGTLAALKAHRKDVFDPSAAQHNGRIVKLMGDGVLVEFGSVVDAVQCATDVQRKLLNGDGPIKLRIGINLGDVIVDGDDVYGDGVNVAARLEPLAQSGGICVSDMVYENVRSKLDERFESIGEQRLKNIDRPVTVWRWVAETTEAAATAVEPAKPQARRPSIAVLPFNNMSGDPDQEYFSDGITEDIITELSRFRELFVIARNSSFSYKGKQVKVQEIAQDLGVAYIVEGSVRKAGNRLRITAQLIEAESGTHIWADRYDRELEDIFDLQDEITQTIVSVLPVRLHSALVETMRRKPSENLSAYDLFLHGRWLFDRTAGQDLKALDLLRQAIQIDPSCAQAHAYLALAHAYSLYNMQPLGEAPAETALRHVELAITDGEGDYFIHAAAANVYIMCGKHQLADSHSTEAFALNPNAIYAQLSRGYILCYLGEPEEGVRRLMSALKYDPHAPEFYHEQVAEGSYMARDYTRAINVYERWKNPPRHMHLLLSLCYAQQNDEESARRAFARHLELCPEGYDDRPFIRAHVSMCKCPEDAEHWLEGYRKVGLNV